MKARLTVSTQCRRVQCSFIATLLLKSVLVSAQGVTEEYCVVQAVKGSSKPWIFDDGETLLNSETVGNLFAAIANSTDAEPLSLESDTDGDPSAVTLESVGNSSSETAAAVLQSSNGATLWSMNSSQAGPAEVSSSSNEAAVAVSNVLSRLTLAAANESSSGDALAAVSNLMSGSSALTASSPDPLAQPTASNASSEPPSFGRTSFVETGTLDMKHREELPNATAVLPSVYAVSQAWSSLLSQGAVTSLVSQAARLDPGREMIFVVVVTVAWCLIVFVVVCSLEARPHTDASGYHQWHQMSQSDKSSRGSSHYTPTHAPDGVWGGAANEFLPSGAYRVSNGGVAGNRQSAQRLSSRSGFSFGDHGSSSPTLSTRKSQPRQSCSTVATSFSLIHEEYVVPDGSECHIALPTLVDKYNFEAQQPITDPEGVILFFVGFVRDAESNESLVLWDAKREHLGKCILSVKGKVGGLVISDSHHRKCAVISVDAARRYTLRRLTCDGSWHLACGEQFRPVWVYDDDRPVAQMAFEGTSYDAFISPNTDVCLLILFVLCCERLHVMDSGGRLSDRRSTHHAPSSEERFSEDDTSAHPPRGVRISRISSFIPN